MPVLIAVWPSIIKGIRESGKFTQTSLGKILGVTSQTISNWEHRRAYPDTYIGGVLLLMSRVDAAELPSIATQVIKYGRTAHTHGRAAYLIESICKRL